MLTTYFICYKNTGAWLLLITCTHSDCDPRDTVISYGTCSFSISTSCIKQWTAYWTCYVPISRNLKSNLIHAFYVIFGFGTITNFPLLLRYHALGGCVCITNSGTRVQSCTLNSLVSLKRSLHFRRFLKIPLSFVVEPF